MNKTLGPATAAAIATLMGTPVLAADMAAPPPALGPAFSWAGCYIGGNAGYAWGSSNVTFTETGAFVFRPPADVAYSEQLGSPNITMSGFTGGGQAGCNYQSENFVIGLEGDGEFTGLKGTIDASGTIPVGGTPVLANVSVSNSALFTARARGGVVIDGTLFYVTGGYAGGDVSYSEFVTHNPGVSFMSGAASSIKSGWTVGGGVEYAITYNWTIKGEYLYVNLGSIGFTAANNLNPAFNSLNSAAFKESIVRLGLNYKFGPGRGFFGD